MDQVIRIGGTKVSRKSWARDPEFYETVERCRRLATEKAKLEEQVERLEAEIEHHRLDAWAQRQEEESKLTFYVAAMADDATDRIGRSTPSQGLSTSSPRLPHGDRGLFYCRDLRAPRPRQREQVIGQGLAGRRPD